MPRTALLLVEDNPTEATLARTALTLHGTDMEVIEASDLESAARIVGRSGKPVALAILGKRALIERVPGLPVPTIVIAPDISSRDRERAAAAGIRAVFERPRDWHAYSALVGRLLADWVPTGRDSAPHRGPTS